MTHLFRRIPHIRGVTRSLNIHFDIFRLIAQGEVAQLISLVEHVITNGEIDDCRQDRANPYWQVVRINAERVPFRADPAPELGRTNIFVSHES